MTTYLSLKTAEQGGGGGDTMNGEPCVCLSAFPWQTSKEQSQQSHSYQQHRNSPQKEYTDADFAKDMQGLSFREQQNVTEDVHLVANRVQETEDFVCQKVREVQELLQNLSKKRGGVERDAWDRAVFLRPLLAHDKDHYLMFLRAKHYDVYDAATLLLKFYEMKRRVWGDAYLARRIRWEDLSEETQRIFRRAEIMYLPRHHEDRCRRVWYFRMCLTERDLDYQKHMQAISYPFFSNIFCNHDLQRKGRISVIDLRGPWNISTVEFFEHARVLVPLLKTVPARTVAVHILVERDGLMAIARGLQSLHSRDWRVRVRLHVGSWMEIQYSLRSFGIVIPEDCLEPTTRNGSGGADQSSSTSFAQTSIQNSLEEFINIENEWKQKEAPFCDPTSEVALHPNPQDIIMGKHRSVATSWPGNVAYIEFIKRRAVRYGATTNKFEKMTMAIETLKQLKTEKQVRFLTRKENEGWEVISDEDSRLKVSQSLRDEFRKISRRAATTSK